MTRLLYTPGFPPRVGGLPNFMYARCQASPDVEVLAAHAPEEAEHDSRLPFRVHRRNVYHLPRRGIPDAVARVMQLGQAALALRGFLRARRYSVLETATVFPGAVAALLLPEAKRTPLLSYALGDDVRRPLRTWYSSGLYRRTLSRIDRFIAISRFTRDVLLESGVPEGRVAIVHPPLDTVRFGRRGDGAAWRREWPAHERVLLTLCQLSPKKGVDRVLEALPGLVRRRPGLLYVVGGPGPDRPRLEALARRLGVADRVVFLGRVAEERLPDLHAAADVFVMPTRAESDGSVEGFGIVFLEAGSQGVPVIGPNVGGCSDAVRHGVSGYLVDPENVAEIEARLDTLLADPDLRRRFGEAGRARAFEPSDWSPVLSFP